MSQTRLWSLRLSGIHQLPLAPPPPESPPPKLSDDDEDDDDPDQSSEPLDE